MSVRITALLALLVAALTLGAGAGVGAASQSPTKIDFTSPRAVDAFLKSIDVNPATVVKQTGRFNYSGAHCPGSRWTCTTATRVLQISAAGGQNVGECTDNTITPPGQSCVIMQNLGGSNTASCIEHSTTETVQHCVIEQTGDRNFARVDQLLVQGGGSAQDATQTADVKQSSATQQNELQVDQDVQQDTSIGTSQTQNAHQYVVLDQGASGNGNNFAHVHQTQDQNASEATVLQSQNTSGPTGSSVEAACDPAAASASNGLVTTPNACAKFTQSSVNGDNEAHLHQFANESEKSTASATQLQGFAGNGLGGDFEQTVAPLGTGSSHNHTTQHKQQQASSNGGPQTQVDPIGCCGASQIGGDNGLENIDQMSTQSASGGGFFNQNSDLVGTSDSLSGTCSVSHHVRENEASTNFNESDNTPPCSLNVATSCNSFNDGGTSGTCSTTSCPPDCPELVTAPSPLVTVLASIPTLGQTLPALDVTSEPSSYVLPSWYVPF
jgi:hypothetical protein